MIKIVRSVFIFVLVTVLASCEYWNKDMLAYLEYWSSTVQVGRVDKSGAEFKINKDGIETIPVSATPTITAVLINPKGYELDRTKGRVGSGSSVIINNDTVEAFVELPSVSDNNTRFSVKLRAGNDTLEHETFTLTFEPVRTDNQLAVPGKSITLRYNTPPAAPIPVVKTDSGYELVSGGVEWKAADDGTLYWAYYNETDEKEPNCAKSFNVGGSLRSYDDCLVSGATITGSNYKVFSAQTGSARASIAAVDSEGITGAPIVSGQVALARITYDKTIKDGSVGSVEGTVPSPQSFEQGDQVTLADQGTLSRVGYTFAGWQDDSGNTYSAGEKVSFSGDTTLYAQWTPNTYTITFDNNQGSGGPDPDPDPLEVTYGQPLSSISPLSSWEISEGTGTAATFEFTGYNTDKNGTGTPYYNKDGQPLVTTWTETQGITLYAQWKITKVTLDASDITDAADLRTELAKYSDCEITVDLDGKPLSLTFDDFKLHEEFFTVKDGNTVMITNGNISVDGDFPNDTEAVYYRYCLFSVSRGSTLTLSDCTLKGGNFRSAGGTAVKVDEGSATLTNITISNFDSNYPGAGVHVDNGGTVTMDGRSFIKDNRAHYGAAVLCDRSGTFIMNGGEISGNYSENGSTISGSETGTFEWNGGIIYGNTNAQGGGVFDNRINYRGSKNKGDAS